jgi:hypothetical protein
MGKSEGKKPIGRPKLGWEDNIKKDLQEVRCWGMDCIDLTRDRVRLWAPVNVAMNLRFP